MALVPASPNWLLLKLIVVATAAVLDIPVKPAVVAVDVLPLIILSDILSTPAGKAFIMPTTELEEAAPVSTEPMLLLLRFNVIPATAAETIVFAWLMASKTPDVAALLSAIVLFVMALTKVPEGAVVIKSE